MYIHSCIKKVKTEIKVESVDKKNRKKTAKNFPFLAEVYVHSLYIFSGIEKVV